MLTAAAIAAAHGIDRKVVQNSFQRNGAYFTAGVDYFKLTAKEFLDIVSMPSPFFRASNSQGIVLFTKSGYLKLTKSLTDAKAWAVHQTLSDSYFQLEEIKSVMKETGGVYVSEEAMFDDDDLLIAKALKAADIMLVKLDA